MIKTKYDIPEINGLFHMTTDDVEKYAECAALAYYNYPLFQYLTNGSCEHEVIKTIIASSIYAMKDNVVGISTDEEANAVALFAPPQYTGSKTLPFLLNGGIKLSYIAPFSTFFRLLNYEGHAMKLKKQYTNHDSWYLYNITVKPSFQGSGAGSKLLRPMLEYFDRVGESCYLETHNEGNVGLYQHFGFDLVDVSEIPKTDVKQYSMLRKPR